MTIRINALPEATNPAASSFLAVDGATTEKATLQKVVDAGAPVASQAEAEAGDDNSKRMTALRTKQYVEGQIGNTIASAASGALANTAVQPGDLGDSAALDVGTTAGTVAAGDDERILTAEQAATFADVSTAQSATIPARNKRLRTQFYAVANRVGGANYRRISFADLSGYPALAYFRSADRFAPDGSTDATNGGYWVLDEAEAKFTQFGAFVNASTTVNRDALRAGVGWAHQRYLATGWQVVVSLPSGDYAVGNGDLDASADWRHICHVYDGVIVRGPGRLLTNTPFSARAVLFVVRGDDVLFDGIDFYDAYTVASNWIIPIGMGTAYDSGLESGRTYKDLEVKNCFMLHAWIGVSVQMASSDDGTISVNGVRIHDNRVFANPSTASSGNLNARSDPPGKIKNVSMYNNVAKDGKTASSFNFVGIDTFRSVNNESHRNLYAACEIENGCIHGLVSAIISVDGAIGVWIDDSKHVHVAGVDMQTTTETLVTPLLGTLARARRAVYVTCQGFATEPDYVTDGIVVQGVTGEFNRVELGAFGVPVGSPKIGKVVIDGYMFNGDGVARASGNAGIFSSQVDDLTVSNARIVGAGATAIQVVIPTGGVLHLANVTTKKAGSETTIGLTTSSAGRLSLVDCDLHAVSLGHTGGTDAVRERINGVQAPDRMYYAEATIADDGVAAIDLPAGFSSGNILVEAVTSQNAWGRARAVWSGVAAGLVAAGANGSTFAINATAGVLTGTTGTDGFLTIRANTDGKLYIENRLGASRVCRVHWES